MDYAIKSANAMKQVDRSVAALMAWAFQKLADQPVVYVWAGLPIFLVMTSFMTWSILLGVGYALFSIWNQNVQSLGTDIWFFVLIYGQVLFLVPMIYFAELCAYRVIWSHMHNRETVGWRGALTLFTERPTTIVFWLLVSTALFFGTLAFCLLPVLIYSLLRPLAVCIFVVDGVGPVEAHLRAVRQFKTRVPYHTKTIGIGVLLNMALSQIPLVGPPFGTVLAGLIHLKAYTNREISS